MSAPVTESKSWDALWDQKMAQYLNTTPRTGIFVDVLFPQATSFLELGAGSARDAYYLSQRGKAATASDFSESALETWKRIYGESFSTKLVDAFNIDARDRAYDVTFHNGLYVLFEDDQIERLIVEQHRVSSQAMVIITHNKRNVRLESTLKERAKSDPLYRIRFFDAEDIVALVKRSGVQYDQIEIKKFGGPADRIYRILGADAGHTNRSKLSGSIVTTLYPLQPWSRVERSAVVVHLKRKRH